jgi:hypothetical protein
VNMRTRHAVVLLAIIAVMTACPSSQEEPRRSSADSSPAGAASISVESGSQSVLPPGVSARLSLSKSAVASGEPVTVRLVLHNPGPRDEELGLASPGQRFDIVVVDSVQREVWSRLHRQDITLVRFSVPLRAKDSLVFTERWDQRDNDNRAVPLGAYTVRGYLSPRTPGISSVATARLRVCPASGDC